MYKKYVIYNNKSIYIYENRSRLAQISFQNVKIGIRSGFNRFLFLEVETKPNQTYRFYLVWSVQPIFLYIFTILLICMDISCMVTLMALLHLGHSLHQL